MFGWLSKLLQCFKKETVGYLPTDFQKSITNLGMAKAAALAYEGKSTIENVVRNVWKFDGFKFIEYDDTQCFIAWDSSRVILSFRGTEAGSLEDISHDADTWMRNGIHAGFEEALMEVFETIRCELGHLSYDAIYVTGHSLGAALATLFCYKWSAAEIGGVYTFGSPRVGNDSFVRSFNSYFKGRSYRYVNAMDIVTRLPPRTMGFAHVDDVCYMTEDGQLSSNEWYRFLDIVRNITKLSIARSSVREHAIVKYVKKLEQIYA